MKTREQAKKQVERILRRLVDKQDDKLFTKVSMRLLDYVQKTYC